LQTPDKVAPYIEEVVPGLVLVAGGNGYAAKSCDEIGRIAAKLATKGQWTSDIPQSTMKVIWRPRGPTCKL
jgi:sarcosine oxidase/L-pipecolate oxidase